MRRTILVTAIILVVVTVVTIARNKGSARRNNPESYPTNEESTQRGEYLVSVATNTNAAENVIIATKSLVIIK